VNIPALTQFPVLTELLIFNTNQTGAFVCHSSVIKWIESYSNHYTSADISDCTNLMRFNLSGSQLDSLDIGTADNLIEVKLKDCGLTEPQTDYVLQTLDEAGLSNGYLELTGNAAPSAEGLVHHDSLEGRAGRYLLNFLFPLIVTVIRMALLSLIPVVYVQEEIQVLHLFSIRMDVHLPSKFSLTQMMVC